MNCAIKTLVIASLASFALAACQSPSQPRPTLNASFGDAVRHNMAVQIINPEGHPDLSPPPMDGERAGLAIERYRTDQTKELVEQRTSEVGEDSN